MRARAIAALAAAGAALAASWPTAAHHAFAAEFDVKRPISLRGTVVRVELINPHSWIHIDVKDANGTAVAWMIEGGSPNSLLKRGVNRNSVPVGSELVIDGYQARDGSNRAVGRNIAFADGRPLFFGGTAPDAGDAPPPSGP